MISTKVQARATTFGVGVTSPEHDLLPPVTVQLTTGSVIAQEYLTPAQAVEFANNLLRAAAVAAGVVGMDVVA